LYDLVCVATPLCFVSSVYGDKGMQIQCQLGLLTFTSVGWVYETTSCLKDRKLMYDV